LLAHSREREAEAVVSSLEREVERSTGHRLPPVDVETVVAATPARRATLMEAVHFLWSASMAQRTAVVWLLWFVQTFTYCGFFNWIPTLLVQRGITVTRSFEFSIIIYLAQAPGFFSAAWASERIDRTRTMPCACRERLSPRFGSAA
jgi:putative MFS transporter